MIGNVVKTVFSVILFIISGVFLLTTIITLSLGYEDGIGIVIFIFIIFILFPLVFGIVLLKSRKKEIVKKEIPQPEQTTNEEKVENKEKTDELIKKVVKNLDIKVSYNGTSTNKNITATTVKKDDNLTILYRDTKGELTLRRIHPEGMKLDAYGNVSIRAYCYMREAYREFKLARIEKALFNDARIDGEDLVNLFPYFKEHEPEGAKLVAQALQEESKGKKG